MSIADCTYRRVIQDTDLIGVVDTGERESRKERVWSTLAPGLCARFDPKTRLVHGAECSVGNARSSNRTVAIRADTRSRESNEQVGGRGLRGVNR